MRRHVIALAGLAIVAGVAAVRAPGSAAREQRAEPDGPCWMCHAAAWSEWQASRHAASWRDPIFQAEFAHGRPAWCVGCHAPLAPDPAAPDDTDARVTAGVSCAACHQSAGHMVSARRAAASPHATIVDPSFGSPDFCAGCHQFTFPILGQRGRLVRYTSEPMQATVAEWRGSKIADECVDCHADSPGGHAFAGSHDPERVADALAIAVCRSRSSAPSSATGSSSIGSSSIGSSAIEVGITNQGAGHNVPSGGVHRRMVVRAWRSTAPERFVEYTLGRKFRPLSGGGKETISDTTIVPGATSRSRFPLAALGPPPASDAAVNLELRYIYALDERADLPGTDVSHVIWHQRVDPNQLTACSE